MKPSLGIAIGDVNIIQLHAAVQGIPCDIPHDGQRCVVKIPIPKLGYAQRTRLVSIRMVDGRMALRNTPFSLCSQWCDEALGSESKSESVSHSWEV